MRSELREIRSVIEAYSKTAILGNQENASANGIAFSDKGEELKLRVTTNANTTLSYILDRWE